MHFRCERVSIDRGFRAIQLDSLPQRRIEIWVRDSGWVDFKVNYLEPKSLDRVLGSLELYYNQGAKCLSGFKIWFANSTSPGYNPGETFKKVWSDYEREHAQVERGRRDLINFLVKGGLHVDLGRMNGMVHVMIDEETKSWQVRADRSAHEDPHYQFEQRDVAHGFETRHDDHWPLALTASFPDCLTDDLEEFCQQVRDKKLEGEDIETRFNMVFGPTIVPPDSVPLRL